MKILLTAFEPFGGQSINASQETARHLRDQHFEGAQLEFLDLPVQRFKATQMVLEAIARTGPQIVIMMGEARGRSAITPERVAINLDSYPIPDNAGAQPQEEAIVPHGPAAYFSTLPIVSIVEALKRESIPASISNTAGTYLCNHLFYGVQHHLKQLALPLQAGFIHLPTLPEQRPTQESEWPSLERETLVKGIRLSIGSCIQASLPGPTQSSNTL